MKSNNFSDSELACPCCGVNKINRSSLNRLQVARDLYGEPITLSSAYRCDKHNKEVGGHKLSTHVTGHAFDIVCSHAESYKIIAVLIAAGFTRIGVAQKGDLGKRFIHGDDSPNTEFDMTLWSY